MITNTVTIIDSRRSAATKNSLPLVGQAKAATSLELTGCIESDRNFVGPGLALVGNFLWPLTANNSGGVITIFNTMAETVD